MLLACLDKHLKTWQGIFPYAEDKNMSSLLQRISRSTPHTRDDKTEISHRTVTYRLSWSWQALSSTSAQNSQNTEHAAFLSSFLFKATLTHLSLMHSGTHLLHWLLCSTSLTRFQTRNFEDGTWLLISDKPQQLPHCHPTLVRVTKIDRSSHSIWKWYSSQHEDHYMVDVFIVW